VSIIYQSLTCFKVNGTAMLRPTASRSVSFVSGTHLRPLTNFYFFIYYITFSLLRDSLLGAPSLTRGRVCSLQLPSTLLAEVEVKLQLTVSQSVCQGIEPTLRLVTRYYFVFVFWKLLSCLCRAPSLTRGRVCYLSFTVCSNLPVFISIIYVTCVLQFNNVYTIYVSFIQSRLSTAAYALLVIITPQ
jgi:hypothetical protein